MASIREEIQEDASNVYSKSIQEEITRITVLYLQAQQERQKYVEHYKTHPKIRAFSSPFMKELEAEVEQQLQLSSFPAQCHCKKHVRV